MEPNAAGLYADPIGSAPVVDNATPYTSKLVSLSEHLGDRTLPRVAVGRSYSQKLVTARMSGIHGVVDAPQFSLRKGYAT
jgi:hypothetical protein